MVKIKLPKGLPSIKLVNNKVAEILNDMADITVKQIYNDTIKGKDIEGKNFKRLSQATINRKRKKGYPATPLVGTGRMAKVFKSDKASGKKLKAVVSTANDRKKIARITNINDMIFIL